MWSQRQQFTGAVLPSPFSRPFCVARDNFVTLNTELLFQFDNQGRANKTYFYSKWFKYNLSLFRGATFDLNVCISRLVPLQGTVCLKYSLKDDTTTPEWQPN